MAEISTDIYRAELAVINWLGWQNGVVCFRQSLDCSSSEDRTVYVNEEEALRTERILLMLKAVNFNVYESLVVYYQNRDHKFVKNIAEMLGICDNTLRSRVDFGLEYLAGELL